MLEVGSVVAGAHLELVPEIERDGGTVEARSDVGRAGWRADA
jgi:hypothetical protein